MRILIVEDEALIAMALAETLEDGGHQVLGPCASAAEAETLCALGLPDLALLDVNLGEGGCGVALARTLRARWGLPVIFASGQSPAASDVALGSIRKPYDAATILRSLDVAADLIAGRHPASVPGGFNLYH
jgi:DNA-binding response OmpR family regulator